MSEISPLVKRSLVDQALDQLRLRINQGTWVVGQRLPTEPELSTELGISRNTVREAMRVLAFSGLIEIRQDLIAAKSGVDEWVERVARVVEPIMNGSSLDG